MKEKYIDVEAEMMKELDKVPYKITIIQLPKTKSKWFEYHNLTCITPEEMLENLKSLEKSIESAEGKLEIKPEPRIELDERLPFSDLLEYFPRDFDMRCIDED